MGLYGQQGSLMYLKILKRVFVMCSWLLAGLFVYIDYIVLASQLRKNATHGVYLYCSTTSVLESCQTHPIPLSQRELTSLPLKFAHDGGLFRTKFDQIWCAMRCALQKQNLLNSQIKRPPTPRAKPMETFRGRSDEQCGN